MRDTAKVPDFFVIGAAKAGTTTLHRHLQGHPGLFLADPKEPDFFSDQQQVRDQLDEYLALFAEAGPDQRLGEMSTTYSRWPHTDDVPMLLTSVCPDPSLVYVLRHPVDRAYSHYGHHMRHGVTMTFEEALERDSIYVDCSRYDLQLRRWERVVEPDQIALLRFSELVARPQEALRRVTDHLGVAPAPAVDADLQANVRGEHHLRRRLTDLVESVPLARAVVDAVPAERRRAVFRWISSIPIGQRIRQEVEPPPMESATRERLLELLEPVTVDIERRTRWDLSAWRR